jgi:uroporphyrinogen decarboxylase
MTFDSIDGIFILDDIVGFCGEPDFKAFSEPYLKPIFNCMDVSVRFFHNDADGKVCAPYLPKLGVSLFNFSFGHSLDDMKQWTNNTIALVGNIPPRDVLAMGSTVQIEEATKAMIEPLPDYSRIIFSCGGGLPDGVSTEQILAFQRAVEQKT